MSIQKHAKLAADVIDALEHMTGADIHEKIAVLKTATNMLENKMSAAMVGNHIAQMLKN